MTALLNFLDMGGYAFYVWTSYAVTVIVLALNLIGPMRRDRQVRQHLRRTLGDRDGLDGQ